MGLRERFHMNTLLLLSNGRDSLGPAWSLVWVFCVLVFFTGHLSTYFLHDIPARIMMSDWVWFFSVLGEGKGRGPVGILWLRGPARLLPSLTLV